MIDPVVAWDKLSNFDTATEIREYFQQEDIKGYRGVIESCPIAQWMQQLTGADLVRVSGRVTVYQGLGCDLDKDFNHTKATLDFVVGFDSGRYPELELRG